MAFIQLAARRSMRDGLRCLSAAGSRLYPWGLKNVARSHFYAKNSLGCVNCNSAHLIFAAKLPE